MLVKWREQLVDLSWRNRLVNLNRTKTSTVGIKEPGLAEVIGGLSQGGLAIPLPAARGERGRQISRASLLAPRI